MSRAAPDILAVDGGNSKVDVALVRADGVVLGAARGGGTPFSPGSEARSIEALLDAVARACREAAVDPQLRPLARVAVLCVCGADLPVDDRRISRALKPLALAHDLLLRNDTFAVLRAGTDRSWGVGVVCGAGMNCSAVGPTGRVVRYAALGEISGDGGGGGWFGQQAVRAAVRGRDGRGPHTLLERLVPQHFGLRTVPAVLQGIQTGRIDEYSGRARAGRVRGGRAGRRRRPEPRRPAGRRARRHGRFGAAPPAPHAPRRRRRARRRRVRRRRRRLSWPASPTASTRWLPRRA